tara:strand:- start:126 stop:293 length:168 start_codon:yes stop_codon:yes gene_type:complete
MSIKVLVEIVDKKEEEAGDSVDYLYRILTNKNIPQEKLEQEIVKAVIKCAKNSLT